MANKIIKAIHERRSRREFTDKAIAGDDLREIVRAGIWAPSGLNNQPWRFVIITDAKTREELSATTHYSHIVLGAQALIAVFLDSEAVYDPVKDQQSAGACIQNMLLTAEALSLGGVWLGQILKKQEQVCQILDMSDRYALAAVVALGHPAHYNQKSNRKDLNHFILKTL
ncbi:MAG: nitroreductase family protein [Deltaproteobacteria bacterium]|jgi:nitroreductase|nr:nitroreductase family protein [Deltaproteobacteria bacterium]